MTFEADHVRAWLDAERAYAETKWPVDAADRILAGPQPGVGPDSEYRRWILQYLHRAHVLGLDNPAGRQALAKALRTLLSATEAAVRLHGPLPPAGVSSGNLDGVQAA